MRQNYRVDNIICAYYVYKLKSPTEFKSTVRGTTYSLMRGYLIYSTYKLIYQIPIIKVYNLYFVSKKKKKNI